MSQTLQLEILSEDSNNQHIPPSQEKGQNRRKRFCIGVLIIIGICILGYVVIRIVREPFYAVIIDAGSTGSRVQAFGFHKSISSGNLVLDSEFYASIEPGLSSFADNPGKGAESLQVLLDEAKASIPKSKWRYTPLSLKATAGLRLLPKEKANRLLEECEKLFEKSGFLTSTDSVSILNGTDEGIFSWVTVNFLFDRLSAQSHENTVAALDLGGGSTQVTFVPDEKHVKYQEEDIFTVNVFGNNIRIYTRSYLGMGLLAARKEIFTRGQNLDIKRDENGSPESIIELHSECIHPTISTEWSYGGMDYLVKGSTNGTDNIEERQNFTGVKEGRPVVRFSECLQVVKNYIDTITNKPLGLENHEIVAISEYFYLAKEVGLLDESTGGTVRVDDYLKHAMVHCNDSNIERPFLCLDLIFVYVLLRDGFSLQPTTQLQVSRRVNNNKLSWALGAAFDILRNKL